MIGLSKGRYVARIAKSPEDIAAAKRVRGRAFGCSQQWDEDDFDGRCIHVIIEDRETGDVVSCFRLLTLQHGAEIRQSYSAQYYDLSALTSFPGPMVELGRFCIAPDRHDPDILRVAWGALTQYVDSHDVKLLFGCTSFSGTDQRQYYDAFAMLRDRHIAPKRWLPQVKAPNVFPFAKRLKRRPDTKRAMLGMPPLLRTYLMMGGWVSDHAVVDTKMNTLHVFTGVEIATIPPARKRLLRAVAQ